MIARHRGRQGKIPLHRSHRKRKAAHFSGGKAAYFNILNRNLAKILVLPGVGSRKAYKHILGIFSAVVCNASGKIHIAVLFHHRFIRHKGKHEGLAVLRLHGKAARLMALGAPAYAALGILGIIFRPNNMLLADIASSQLRTEGYFCAVFLAYVR